MIRKSIALLLALALLLCGTACGKQTEEKPTSSNADDNPPASVVTPDYTIEDYLAAIDRGDFETVLIWLAQYADTDILTDERIVDFLDKIAILPVEEYRNGEHILYSYDEKGHLIKEEYKYDDEEEYNQTYEYPHDEHNQCLSYSKYEYAITPEYDEYGNVTKETYTGEYDSYEILYSYNDKYQLIRKESTENYLGYTEIYTYHANGHVASKIYTSSSGGYTQTFNENGQLLSNDAESNDHYNNYTYDEDGRLIGQEYNFEPFDEPRKATFFYDEEGRYLGYHSATLSGDQVREGTYTYYTYDGHDYLLSSKSTDEDGNIDETIYTYEKDRLMSKTYIKNGETISEAVYTYNEDGRLKSIGSGTAFTYQDGKLISVKKGDKMEYTYTYNEDGDIATISNGVYTYNGYGVAISRISEEQGIYFSNTYRVLYFPDGVPKCLENINCYLLYQDTYGMLYDYELYRGLPEKETAATLMPAILTDENVEVSMVQYY